MGHYIVDRNSGNFISGEEGKAFTNHIGHALKLADVKEARAMHKGAAKMNQDADLVILAEVE